MRIKRLGNMKISYKAGVRDCYTVAVPLRNPVQWDLYTMSGDPTSPQGVNQWAGTVSGDLSRPDHWSDAGTELGWDNVPLEVVSAVLARINQTEDI